MGDRWDRLGEEYGERSRSALFDQVAAWLLREEGARLPRRVEPKPVVAHPDEKAAQ